MNTKHFVLVILVFVLSVQGMRYDGFWKYSVTAGDVIFNPFGEQLKIHYIDTANSSINATIVYANSTAVRTQLTTREQHEFRQQCIVTNRLYEIEYGKAFAEVTWSQNPCTFDWKPAIFDVQANSIGERKATIEWETHIASNSTALFWAQGSVSPKQAEYSAYSTSHAIILQRLRPATTYFYRVTSCSGPNSSNCSTAGEFNFTTGESTGFYAEGMRSVDFPLHKGVPVEIEGYSLALKNANSTEMTVNVLDGAEDLCARNPMPCTIKKGETNAQFSALTGFSIAYKDASESLAIASFTVPQAAKFPPALIIRPYEKVPQATRQTTFEVLAYEVNLAGKIIGANFSYDDNGTVYNRSLSAGKNEVQLTFAKDGFHTITVSAENAAGKLSRITRQVNVEKIKYEPAAPTAIPSKKKPTPTPVVTLSAIEQVREKLAKERKPPSIWDYAPYAIAALVIGGALAYFAVIRKRKPPLAKTPPTK